MKEWVEDFGGRKDGIKGASEFRPLPYYCCALSLQPFEDPVATLDGIVYDITYVLISAHFPGIFMGNIIF